MKYTIKVEIKSSENATLSTDIEFCKGKWLTEFAIFVVFL